MDKIKTLKCGFTKPVHQIITSDDRANSKNYINK